MADCVFCKIASGAIPAKMVYKGVHTMAFLDIHPLAKGHTLVIPTRHVERVEEMSADLFAQHMSMVPRIVRAVVAATGATGATIAWNNGPAAGQEVAHAHMHIVPRFADDGAGPIHGMFTQRPMVSPQDMDAIAAQMKKQLGG